MDGNRRWAKARGLQKFAGHKYGVDNLENLLNFCLQEKIEIVTVYALSTENLKREKAELENLFGLLEKYLRKTEQFTKKNIQIRILGNPCIFPESTQKAIQDAVAKTKNCDKLIFNIALNYGGRDEIIRAVQKMQNQGIEITEKKLEKNLDTGDLPPPDLIIRTGGDQRLSNFLLWQTSYATLYFTPVLWPAFDKIEFEKALEFFKSQKQNYGK